VASSAPNGSVNFVDNCVDFKGVPDGISLIM